MGSTSSLRNLSTCHNFTLNYFKKNDRPILGLRTELLSNKGTVLKLNIFVFFVHQTVNNLSPTQYTSLNFVFASTVNNLIYLDGTSVAT
jgi:hypothetical protein